jgi:hypothetical protein
VLPSTNGISDFFNWPTAFVDSRFHAEILAIGAKKIRLKGELVDGLKKPGNQPKTARVRNLRRHRRLRVRPEQLDDLVVSEVADVVVVGPDDFGQRYGGAAGGVQSLQIRAPFVTFKVHRVSTINARGSWRACKCVVVEPDHDAAGMKVSS